MPIIGNEEKNYAKYLAPDAAIKQAPALGFICHHPLPTSFRLDSGFFFRINAPHCTGTQTSFFLLIFLSLFLFGCH